MLRATAEVLLTIEIGSGEASQPTKPENLYKPSRKSLKIMKVFKIRKSPNLEVFIGYLDAQESDRVHILQFRSTHQYYRAAKYQLHRTTGDGDN